MIFKKRAHHIHDKFISAVAPSSAHPDGQVEEIAHAPQAQQRLPIKTCVFLLALTGSLCFGYFKALPGYIETRALESLAALGYKRASIENVTLRSRSFALEKVKLDPKGFNTIETVFGEVDWIDFFQNQNIKSLSFVKLSLSLVPDKRAVQTLGGVFQIIGATAGHVGIFAFENAVLDLSTRAGDIRLEANSLIEEKVKGTHTIHASVWANQYQLSFKSSLAGKLSDNGFAIDTIFEEGRVMAGPVHISRANGWMTIESAPEKPVRLTGNLDAGGGTVFDIPLQNITMMIQGTLAQPQLVFKSYAAGAPSISLTADYGPKDIGLTLEVPKIDQLHTLLGGTFIEDQEKAEGLFTEFNGLYAKASYLPERRFARGPLPFEALVNTKDGQELLNGHFLIYPENFDMRGQADINKAFAKDLGSLSKPLNDRINGDLIRLDGNLKKFVPE